MADDKLIVKIKKLLRLATSPVAAEAQAAAAKAQELMTEHQLTQQEVDSTADAEANPMTEHDLGTWRLSTVEDRMVPIIRDFFFVKVHQWYKVEYSSRGRKNVRKLTLIGRKHEVEIAAYMFGYLTQACERCWREHRKQDRAARASAYILGFVTGLREQLQAARHRVETERALVVVEDPALKAGLSAFSQRHGLVPHRSQTRTALDLGATAAGHRDGKNLAIRTGVTGSKQRQLT